MNYPEGSPQTPPQRERPLNANEIAYLNEHVPRVIINSPKRYRSSPSPSPRSPSHTKKRRHGGKNKTRSRKQRRQRNQRK